MFLIVSNEKVQNEVIKGFIHDLKSRLATIAAFTPTTAQRLRFHPYLDYVGKIQILQKTFRPQIFPLLLFYNDGNKLLQIVLNVVCVEVVLECVLDNT